MSQKQIKAKIRGVDKTRQVAKAMEAVSAVKMRKSQELALLLRTYAISAFKILKRISAEEGIHRHPLMTARPVSKSLYIVITSDRGLAGSLNSGVIKIVNEQIATRRQKQDQLGFIVVGRKAYEYWSKRDFNVIKHFNELGDTPSEAELKEVADYAISEFKNKDWDEVYVAYSNFVSTFEQRPTLHKILPLHVKDVTEIINSIVPQKGKYSGMFAKIDGDSDKPTPATLEPSPEELLDELLPTLINIALYHTMLEAKASEFSARMVAMKSAGDKALEVRKSLNRTYNKVRQSSITREVSEIVGGIEAMAKN